MIPMELKLISCDDTLTVIEADLNGQTTQLSFDTNYLTLQYDPLEAVVKQFVTLAEQDTKSVPSSEDIHARFATPITLTAEDTAKIIDRERIDNTGAVVDIVLQILQEHKLI